jgi:hypothetical protein
MVYLLAYLQHLREESYRRAKLSIRATGTTLLIAPIFQAS